MGLGEEASLVRPALGHQEMQTGVGIRAILDLFNVFNSKTVLGFESFDQWSELYLSPSWIPMPRRLQVGLKLEF